MTRSYDMVMEKVAVTPEMRERILDHLQTVDISGNERTSVIRFPNLKGLSALAACLALVLLGAFALPRLMSQGPSEPPNVLLPNGFTVVEDAASLSAAVGYPVEDAANLPFSPSELEYAYLDDLAQIIYRAGDQEAVYRKAPGTDDVSGDYNAYPDTAELEANGRTVTLKGSGDGYVLAIWTDGDYAYSLSLTNGETEAVWREIFLLQPAQ